MELNFKKIFDNNLFLKMIETRYKLGFQNVIIITGDTNSGKTKLGLWYYYLINKYLLHKKYNQNDFFYSIKDIACKITRLKNQNIFYDEAGDELTVTRWNSIFNKWLSLILQTQRIKRNFYFIILPHIRLITHTHYPLLDFHLIVKNKMDLEKCKLNRSVNIYNVVTKHLMINQYDEFINYKIIGNFNIPDYKISPELKEFKNMVETFEKFEIIKKDNIAQKIQNESLKMMTTKDKLKNKINNLNNLNNF